MSCQCQRVDPGRSHLGGVEEEARQGKAEEGDEKNNRDSDHFQTRLTLCTASSG